jgi:hypothetical protein
MRSTLTTGPKLRDHLFERVHALLGQVKIVLLIRDPIERLWSQIRMIAKDTGRDPVDGYWDIVGEFACEKNSDYQKFIPIWQSNIQPKDLGIFNFHALGRDPESFYKDVLSFLDLPTHQNNRTSEVVHQGASSSISPEIMKDMQSRLGPQIDFLTNTFGESWKEGSARMRG